MASFNVTVDDSSPLLSYSPADAWSDSANGTAPVSSYRASSYHTTKVQGASASFSFTGTGVWFFGAKLPSYGGYNLAIDGQTVITASATSSASQFDALLGGAGGLSNGKHTAVLSTTDGSGIDVDQVMFETQIGTPSSRVSSTIVDDADPAIKYTGQWGTPNPDPRFKDNTLHFSSDGGAKATYTFTGEALGIYGTTSTDHGDVKVTIDGNAVTVDPYAGVKTLHLQNLLYFVSGLTPGQHTVEFEGNPGLAGNTPTFADLDYFQVYTADPPANNGGNNGVVVASPSATAAASESTSTNGFTTSVLPAKASSKTSIGPIIAGVIGGLILLALLAAAFFFLWRRRRNNGGSGGSNKRRTFMTPATPALPLQFGPDSSPIDTEKGGPTLLVPTFASAPAPSGYNNSNMNDYYNRGPSMGGDLSRTSTGDSNTPLILGAPLPRKPSATAARTMPSRAPGGISRAGTPEMKQMPMGAPPEAPATQAQRAIRPMASNRSLNAGGGAPFRPSRPPSLQLTAVDIAAPIPKAALQKPQAPTRPARPHDPHLSVLHDRRAVPEAPQYALPTRPSRPSSPHLSDVDQPVPAPASKKPVRPARPERESFGTVVDLYSRR